MSGWVDLGVGLVAEPLVSALLKYLIAEAKKIKDFKPLSRDLASTMENLIPLIKDIDSIQDKLDFGAGDLKELKETIGEAKKIVLKCRRGVPWLKRAKLTTQIKGIDNDMRKFCQFELQLRLYRNQLKLLEVTRKLEDSVHSLSKRIDHSSVPAPPVFLDRCSAPKLNMVPVGLNLPLMELKTKLLNDSVESLVVSAPPGCGKTTLVTQLCHDEEIKRVFTNVFFIVVSSTPSFRAIVQKLLQHNGCEALTFDNDSQAVAGLTNLLEKFKENSKKTLLVLDDVWLGDESLLLKFRVTSPDFKILVTSRYEFPSFGSTYNLKPLEYEDAKALLIQWAPRPPQASPSEYEDLLKKILKRCSGYPIVIEVVGVSLKRLSTLFSWKGKVESWTKGKTILDNPTVIDCLQPSFDALESDLKECFLDMGSFLEDQKIHASVIIDIWVELYGQSSNLCMSYLEDLASQNLLKLVPLGSNNEHEDGFYNEFLVTQHDVLRELALFQSKSEATLEKKRLNLEIKEDEFPECCSNLSEPISARLLSIFTDDLFTSNWMEMDCPNVEALVLNLTSSEYTLPSFIARMKKLKVLTIINHGFYPARLRNFSCLSSLQNLKRIRLEKVSITLLDISQLQLCSLRKLSLFMCSFGEVFYDTEDEVFYDTEDIVVSKALPSLQEIHIDYCYNLDELPYWVSEVVSLKTLSITNCNKLSTLPEAIGNLSKLEVLRLCSCIHLSELPETIERLSNLRFLNISHCLGLKKLPQEIGKLKKLKNISMSKCSVRELPDSVTNLEDLEVKCDEETGFLWEMFESKMRNLTVHEEETEHHNLNRFQLY